MGTISLNGALAGSYDYGGVARSILIAIAASYAALDLAGRVTGASGRFRVYWLAAAATAMGVGISETNFEGLLSLRLSLPVWYHWPTVAASYVSAILISAAALSVVIRDKIGKLQLYGGSLIMGGGIAVLLYVTVAAMRLAAVCRFNPLVVIISIVLALVLSFAALELTFGLREETRGRPWQKIASALVMGAAISAVHYTGMGAATFVATTVPPNLTHAVDISPLGTGAVSVITLIVLGVTIVTSSADREAKEDARIHDEEMFRLVADSVPVLIWMAGTDKLCTYFNKPWLEFTGRPIEEQLGNGWAEGVHPEDLERCMDTYVRFFDRRESFSMEYRLRRHDGEYRSILDSGAPRFNPDGCFAGYIGSAINLTDQKRAAEQLRETQADFARVARATMMDGLVAAIAHEVNQPLAAIVTNANFCIREIVNGDGHPERLREAIAEIANDGTRASAVIARIRTLLQKSAPERVPVDMNQIVEEVTRLLRREVTENRITLRTDLENDLPLVLGDKVQLLQVVINLVMNSIEAMRFTVSRPRELLIRTARSNNNVSIQIQDCGEGLDPQRQEHIFEPFFTTKAEGIGMGLSISRSIVESHGGRIGAEPVMGGALFQFTLPT